MGKELVVFKGIKEGIFLNIDTDNMDLIKRELDKKLKDSGTFYKGIKLLGIKSDFLSEDDIIDLKLLLKYKYDFLLSQEDIPEHIFKKEKKDDIVEKTEKEKTKVKEERISVTEEGMTIIVNRTIRSGQAIEYDGNIVVVGDVNPGAVLRARGSIIVLGSLRGLAYAGDSGDLTAIVASYNLQPTQLRIGDIISRPPDHEEEGYNIPEIARIHKGNLIIEPYLPNK